MAHAVSTHQQRAGSAGVLLKLIRSGKAATRSELAELTGLARSTVTQRIELLMAAGLISEVGDAPSTGGRPPSILGFNAESGVLLIADLGASHSRIAISSLDSIPIADTTFDMPIAEGPTRCSHS